ncbi:cysteine rich repeat-containing domain protein [Ancylostoma ceylanicum]|uniref:Cysteine rich repeat-containing domain protein n=1 Tax=Ancylostoma ceylanicum TaxID=53326 RepID=A0A0D6MCT7_9BILA|nr:cysteine rich repeat-containing domain protein [Ancylostoma ceylanicum]
MSSDRPGIMGEPTLIQLVCLFYLVGTAKASWSFNCAVCQQACQASCTSGFCNCQQVCIPVCNAAQTQTNQCSTCQQNCYASCPITGNCNCQQSCAGVCKAHQCSSCLHACQTGCQSMNCNCQQACAMVCVDVQIQTQAPTTRAPQIQFGVQNCQNLCVQQCASSCANQMCTNACQPSCSALCQIHVCVPACQPQCSPTCTTKQSVTPVVITIPQGTSSQQCLSSCQNQCGSICQTSLCHQSCADQCRSSCLKCGMGFCTGQVAQSPSSYQQVSNIIVPTGISLCQKGCQSNCMQSCSMHSPMSYCKPICTQTCQKSCSNAQQPHAYQHKLLQQFMLRPLQLPSVPVPAASLHVEAEFVVVSEDRRILATVHIVVRM